MSELEEYFKKLENLSNAEMRTVLEYTFKHLQYDKKENSDVFAGFKKDAAESSKKIQEVAFEIGDIRRDLKELITEFRTFKKDTEEHIVLSNKNMEDTKPVIKVFKTIEDGVDLSGKTMKALSIFFGSLLALITTGIGIWKFIHGIIK